jgi:hypothetical protein
MLRLGTYEFLSAGRTRTFFIARASIDIATNDRLFQTLGLAILLICAGGRRSVGRAVGQAGSR